MTQALDDYLKTLYKLSEEPDPAAPRRVATGELAQALGISCASVSGMLKRLALVRPRLVDYTPHGGVCLAPAGKRHALLVLRRHRLLEAFLHQTLGYTWDEVHEEADQLEHVISDRLCEGLARHLGWPETDPHGEPIPRVDGTLSLRREQSLALLPVGEPARVLRVSSRDAGLLRYLAEREILPGAVVKISSREPFGGSLKLRCGDRDVELGPEAGEAVFLSLLHEENT